MMSEAAADCSEELAEAVRQALQSRTRLQIVGGNSKAFYGREPAGEPLEVSGNAGIVSYEPTELVFTARGGTRLSEIATLLSAEGQMLAFEPPSFGPSATLGGTIACGLSGPRRPYAGAARDFVLGVKLLNGKGEILSFGGQVMKNVAGYDLSRLMAGSLGTLGVLLEISLKVLPKPPSEITLTFAHREGSAIETMNALAGKPLPLSAACYDGELLYLRFSGAERVLASVQKKLGGMRLEDPRFWEDLREHRLPFFRDERPLWRLSLPPATSPLELAGNSLLDWGGAQRWLTSEGDAGGLRRAVEQRGGHATVFRRGAQQAEVFHPLPASLLALHRRLKAAFDPHGILNPGRMYPDY
jgi:glycolate oxidase FAD binding subunit